MKRERAAALSIALIVSALVTLLLLKPFLSASEGLCFPKDGLVRIYVGSKAIEMIKSIHWHPNAIHGIKNATVAFYSDGSVLWEALFTDSSTAAKLMKMMIDAIKGNQGKLPYLVPVAHNINGTTVYFFADVRGPVHALFEKGNLLIWLQMGKNGLKYLKYLLSCK